MRKMFSLILLLFASIGQLISANSVFDLEKIFEKPREIVNVKPWYGEFNFVLEEEKFIKESEDDERYMFKQIWDFVIDSRGFAYLLDERRIIKFNPRGEFMAIIGRIGKGPGEFMAPYKLSLDEKDNLYVKDQRASVVVFNHDGAFKEVICLGFSFPAFPVELRSFHVDEQGYLYAFQREYSEFGIYNNPVKADK